ncbi:MAG: hypothetical protein FNT15_03915 [Sulfurovum sp.]|nr:MAG: hypothetical protein FNT15_03915 [Sulfurovum sp.]
MSLKSFLPFVAFVVIIGIGVLAHSFDVKWLITIYDVFDNSSAVALAVFASWGFYEYTQHKDKTQKFLNELKKTHEIEATQGAIVVKFGSKANIQDGIDFATKKGINEKLILYRKFGDESTHNNNVDIEDVPRLEEFLVECRRQLSNVEIVHVIFAGAGIGYAIIGDNLSNWKIKYFYHYDNGSYKVCYIDKSSHTKISAVATNIATSTELKNLQTKNIS